MLSNSLVHEILSMHEGTKILAVPEFLSHDYLYSVSVFINNNNNRAREMGLYLRVHAIHA